MKATVVARRIVQHGQQPHMMGHDGWSKMYNFSPAMPGVGSEAHCGDDVNVRHQWSGHLRVQHGGNMVEMPDAQRSLLQGPRSALDNKVTDAAGLPTSADPLTAAKWKVEQLGKTQEAYRIGHQTPVYRSDKPRPRMMACSGPTSATSSLWKNYLSKVQGSAPDPFYRDPTEMERFPRPLPEEVDHMQQKARALGDTTRSLEPQRPYEKNRTAKQPDEYAVDGKVQQVDAFGEARQIPSDAVWFYGWIGEWDTQIKLACPWDHKLVVHRTTAELPWVLEPQWNSAEAARELVKDCIEDFHDLCKKKGYTSDQMPCVINLSGFWSQRRGVLQGLNEMRARMQYVNIADITPIPVNEIENFFPASEPAPKVARIQKKWKAEDHQQQHIE